MTNLATARRVRVLKAIGVLLIVIVVSPIVLVRLFAGMSQDRR